MRRRHLLAGVASIGALGGAGALATGGVPDALGGGEAPEPIEPVTLDTVDAPGSRDGEVTLPAEGRPTFVDFFATWCGPCEKQMPDLVAAHDEIGDEVLFVSVTPENVGGSVDPKTVVEWWENHNGDWLVAADVTAELAAKLNVQNYPTAVAIDETGRIRWSDYGVHTTEEIVTGIETALDR